MASFFASLRRKGPGGIPLWGYAVGTAIVLYFGYRWYAGRNTASSGASADSGTAPIDTSAAQPDYYYGSSPPSDGSGTTDTSIPDTTTDTAPLADDSTGAINGSASIGEKSPKQKKKAHHSAHDHKQGTSHTKRKPIHRRKPGKHQTDHAHAPKKKPKKHSQEKARKVRNARPARIPAGGHTPTEPRTSIAVPIHTAGKSVKHNPRPIHSESTHEAKRPPQKSRKPPARMHR